MTSLDSVVSLYEQIKSDWGKPSPNLKKCGALIDQIKVKFIQNNKK